MWQKILNPFILFMIVGAFLGYFILPELLFSLNLILDKGLGAVIGAGIGYFLGRYV